MKIKHLKWILFLVALPFASCARAESLYGWTGQIWYQLPYDQSLVDSFLSPSPLQIWPYKLEFSSVGTEPKIWEYFGRNIMGPFPPGGPILSTDIFGNTWQLIDANPITEKIVSGNGLLYQLHDNGRVWAFTNRTWNKIDDNHRTKDIVVASGVLYQIHNNYDIWMYKKDLCLGAHLPSGKTCWVRIDNNRASTLMIKEHNGMLIQLRR